MSADAAAAAPAQEGHKVFAGNLAFATTEADIKAIFAEAGVVNDVQIITRGTRSLGYCFITYPTAAEAEAAVSKLNKKVVAGREINVEIAKPQEELEATREAKAAARKEKAAAKKAKQQEAKAAAAANAPAEGEEGAATTTKKTGRTRKPRARKARTDEGEEPDNVDAAAAANGEGGEKKSSTRSRKPKTKAAVVNGEVEAVDGTAAATSAKKTARQPRGPKGAPEGEASKTLLFVANLSFEVDDASLRSAFVELGGPEPKSTHVVRRRFGARRSKGFGFVDFSGEEEQKKALEVVQGKEWLGRQLSLKVAIQGSKEEAEKEAKDEADKAESAGAA